MKKILGIWGKYDEASLSQLRSEGFNGIFIRTDWVFLGDTMKTYLNRLIKIYEDAKRLGFEFFLIDYSQGMGKLNDNYNYKIVADYFKKFPDVCFYIGEPYEEFVERQKFNAYDVRHALNDKEAYVDGNILIDSTIRNSRWLYLWFGGSAKHTAISSYWRQQTEWHLTNSVWITGQLGYHNPSSWRYKSLSKKSKDKSVIFFYQFNPSNWSSDGWENKLFDSIFGKKLRLKLEMWRRRLFIKYFKLE